MLPIELLPTIVRRSVDLSGGLRNPGLYLASLCTMIWEDSNLTLYNIIYKNPVTSSVLAPIECVTIEQCSDATLIPVA